ncbi:endonuclease domain-containing 1 protein-like [Pseudorasbora parva]|uniref:endonuclease domain-containing 1 protein-like n=1 Tax=Pseudorasbora parva TaxID=51549 RepID=UPI00351F5C43
MRLLVVSLLLLFGLPFIMTEVVDSFQNCREFFFNEQPPVFPGILNNSVSQDNNRYKLICQKYETTYRFATLYDTTNRIPVFSAYKYTGSYTGRPHKPWKIEPQLETLGGEMREPCVHQASSEDYWAQSALNRGHLFPNAHAPDNITAESTFTLTNTVPQYKNFNNGSWVRMEEEVRSIMDSHCRDRDDPNKMLAYVLTGAVPSTANFLKHKVNIPSNMWTAFCCYNGTTWVSQTHRAENKDSNTNQINAKTLENLKSEFLQNKYGSGAIVLFNNECSEFLKT